MPPAIVDVDRDGTKDYIVLILEDGESGRRALLAREWGDAADAFGRTVFYVIIEDNDDVAEWAGNPTSRSSGPPEAVIALPPGVGVAADAGLRASHGGPLGGRRRRRTACSRPSTTDTAAPASRIRPPPSFISRCSAASRPGSIRAAPSRRRSPSSTPATADAECGSTVGGPPSGTAGR